MIQSFFDRGTEDIFDGEDSLAARRSCPRAIWAVARRKLYQVHGVTRLESLRAPPGNRLEKMEGDRAGQHSIRINNQYRVCFIWTEVGPERVEIADYH
ncbi:MAG TPA: type II toxin-antitoxin system RelE/ParE family toxin [Longimicrobium sp.]|jgi:proteic killer suppression protein|uniref:type II toxin-antitoxin system RelE/ParE family toxin n=1 Tax=Longimicrobium sp. TaxID=2029185 RepID=UPI002EDB0421